MRTTLVILFTLLASGVFAQTTVVNDTVFNQVDHLNRKQGHWKKFYRNGKMAYRGFFKDDKPRGTFTRYHENGVVSTIMEFTPCGDTATATLYNTAKRMVAKGNYLRTNKHGVWNYYGQNGQVVFTEEFNEGRKHGKFITYYLSGQIYEQVTWRDDLKHGSTARYYPDGKTQSLIFYKDGVEDGPVRTYYVGGEVRLEGAYANGLKVGNWRLLEPDGKLIREIIYVNGIAANHDELVEEESRQIEELLKNAGKIQEPSLEEFVGGMRY